MARSLQDDALERCRRVLGTLHPWTRAAARSLIETLRTMGDEDDAARLEGDVELYGNGANDHGDDAIPAQRPL